MLNFVIFRFTFTKEYDRWWRCFKTLEGKRNAPSIKDVRTKSLKTPSLSAICPHWLNPSCPCGHTINFEITEFLTSKSAEILI